VADGARASERPWQSGQGRVRNQLQSYHALVLASRLGHETADSLLQWDEARLRSVLGAIDTESDDTRPWTPSRFKAAALMHTDTALRSLADADPGVALVHFDSASQLLKRAGAAERPWAGRWYHAVVRLVRDRQQFPTAEQLLETGRDRFPRDPVILYESGVLQEALAAEARLPVVVNPRDTGASPDSSDWQVGSSVTLRPESVDGLKRIRTRQLNQAAPWFRDALEAAPSNLLTRLHLGRVQSLRDQNEEALALLRGAAASEDAGIAYLALLFTGGLHDRSGQPDAAAEAYRAAIERLPVNHAAYIGLSALLQRSGRLDESRDVLRGLLGTPVANRREPWWFYLADPPGVNAARLDLLRREARQ
jgi:tetratricopeptide (TPR) repeat protein